MIVSVPASTANLGPGFDVLGMALAWRAEIGAVEIPPPDGARVVEGTHPASVAHRVAGGDGRVWVRSPIPVGRGLGFSGAMRAGGAALARVQHAGRDALRADRDRILQISADLDGHPDNVAASLVGGVVAVVDGSVVQVPLGLDAEVVVWVPEATTSTDKSRSRLPDSVPFADAVFNVGRTALLVAALAAGDVEVLRTATQDRLHQQRRLADRSDSRAAMESGLESGAWCAWLSGSGPTVAFLVRRDLARVVVAALPTNGRARSLEIDARGAVVNDAPA
jgi:homoserine kinase